MAGTEKLKLAEVLKEIKTSRAALYRTRARGKARNASSCPMVSSAAAAATWTRGGQNTRPQPDH